MNPQRIKTLFLPLGFAAALLSGMAFPQAARAVFEWRIADSNPVQWVILIVFLISGFQLDLSQNMDLKKLSHAFAVSALLNLTVFPLMWFSLLLCPWMPDHEKPGFAIILCMPTTLSSAIVIARNARSDGLWTLVFTVGLSLLGVFTVPLLLQGLLNTTDHVKVPAAALLFKLLLLVMLPLLTGLWLRRHLGERKSLLLDLLPSACVVFMVWAAIGRTAALSGFHPDLPFLIRTFLLSVVFHVIMLLISRHTAARLNLASARKRAFTFVTSQKSFAFAVTVLMLLPSETAAHFFGWAMVIFFIYHYTQIMLDSLIISHKIKSWITEE